ncbi:MAG: DUF4032 domain-containing protein [Chloroflexi bacterium]|nr:MAG: DUF4032 domain-containing protein [Chloroflexota bacterium]
MDYLSFKVDENQGQEYYTREARSGFEAAMQKNFWQGVASLVSGRRNQLISFEQIIEGVPFEGQYDAGVQDIPVDRIMGSMGRNQDFGAGFLPNKPEIRHRWVKIARANLKGEYLPPVEVFQVGTIYFVRDGNHRVSVARALNQVTIQAHVIVVRIPEELVGQPDLAEAAWKYEQDHFFHYTHLDQLRPEAQIMPTLPGFYRRMLDHIATHRWYMGVERNSCIPRDEAVASWYDHVYLPVVQAIRENHLLAAFPGRSEADLYMWISEYAWFASENGKQPLPYPEAARSFADKSASGLPKLIWRVLERA